MLKHNVHLSLDKFVQWKAIYILAIVLIGLGTSIKPVAAESPVVRAILFYSPNCGHCHKLITEDLPPLIENYGEELLIVGIDVSDPAGQQIYQQAIETFQIPNDRLGVPTLIIGDHVLVGGIEIPEIFPGLIEDYLASGGVDWPAIPGFKTLIESQMESNPEDPDPTITAQTPTVTEENNNLSATTNTQSNGILDRIRNDITGNILAIIVLFGMVAVAIFCAYLFLGSRQTRQKRWQDWAILLLSVIGLGVSIYLSFIEVSKSEAFCGPVGDCNTVQSSQYAFLFGVIPVGIIGIFGYILFIIAWIIKRFNNNRIKGIASLAIWGMAWFGVLFSIYLTFLEPFVIGATCMWCISSAVTMALILLFSTPSAKLAFETMELDTADLESELVEN